MSINRKKRRIAVSRSKLPPEEKSNHTEEKKLNGKNIKTDLDTSDEDTAVSGYSRLKIVNGSRKRRRIVRIITALVILIVIAAVVIINALTPTGIIEAMQNGYAAIGKGVFPVKIYSQNALRFDTYGDTACIVNDSYFEVYNQNGKLIQAASHGMSNPRLELSQARFLIFDRDRYGIKIYNYSDELYAQNFDSTVVSADIGRDGTYAVITGSTSYLNSVYVYDKDNELVYTWNSANYYIMDVAVSDDGEKIALCLINAQNGSYISSVYVMDFDSASPVIRHDFDGLVSSVSSLNSNYLIANGVDCAYVIKWEENVFSDVFSEGVVRSFAVNAEGYSCIAYGRETNEQTNSIAVISPDGVVKADFSFNARINDIAISENNIAVLSDDAVYVFDLSGGNEVRFATEIKPLYVGIIDDSVFVIDNSMMRKLDMTNE